MKLTNTILIGVLLTSVMIGCKENDVQPTDPFVGTWVFESSQTPLRIEFTVTKQGEYYNQINKKTIHPLIPSTEQDNNIVQIIDKTYEGCGVIEIVSRGTFQYAIFLLNNDFDSDGNLKIGEIEINIVGEDRIFLANQLLRKIL
jgi:hypothetical protein